jgi:polysaccharide biosynthesis protein PslH
MKLLFISAIDVNKSSDGGHMGTNRNYLSCCELLGRDNVEVLHLNLETGKTIYKRFANRINQIFGFYMGLSHRKLNHIIKISAKYNYIFLETSLYGLIAYHLKKKKYKGIIITYFHNVEYNIELQRAKLHLLGFLQIYVSYFNEKAACKYSNKIIALNRRDSTELQRIYGANNICLIPLSLPDKLVDHKIELTSLSPTFIFVGSNWYPNILGLKWFIKNVLDHVNIKLQIVGTGLDVLKEKFKHPKIEFLGFVTDLSSILLNADYVISPIFTGSGMKVKTCESLMFGKNIIGTSETFEGYEIDYQKVGAVCNSKEEFINAIKDLCSVKRERFNSYSRECYLEKYSFQATLKNFDELLFK